MKAVLRFGALAVGVALAAGGVGEAGAQQRRAKRPAAAVAAKVKAKAQPAAPEVPERQGPARMTSSTKYGEIPRIEDAKRASEKKALAHAYTILDWADIALGRPAEATRSPAALAL